MTITTPEYGTIEIEESSILGFPEGLIGFEDLTRFVLLYDEDTAPLQWLISVDEPGIGFPVIDASLIAADYRVREAGEGEVVRVIVTIADDGRMTASLRAPIIVNTASRAARQVILSSDRYPFDYPLVAVRAPAQEMFDAGALQESR